jgi:hypothetical protein
MDERSNRDPRELSPRKKAFAREILRRRREAKNEGWWRKHAWLATTAAAFSIGIAVLIPRILRGAVGVCFWHIADIDFGAGHVRFQQQSGLPGPTAEMSANDP